MVAAADPWTTWIRAVQVHLKAFSCCFSIHTVNTFSLPCDVLTCVFSSLADFTVRTRRRTCVAHAAELRGWARPPASSGLQTPQALGARASQPPTQRPADRAGAEPADTEGRVQSSFGGGKGYRRFRPCGAQLPTARGAPPGPRPRSLVCCRVTPPPRKATVTACLLATVDGQSRVLAGLRGAPAPRGRAPVGRAEPWRPLWPLLAGQDGHLGELGRVIRRQRQKRAGRAGSPEAGLCRRGGSGHQWPPGQLLHGPRGKPGLEEGRRGYQVRWPRCASGCRLS